MKAFSAVVRALAFSIALIGSCADRVAAQTYDDLARNPDRFAGGRIAVTGKVIQSLQDGAAYALRVNITSGPRDTWTNTVWIDFKTASPQRILEGDVISIIGTFQGIKSYQAVLGQTIQLPYIVACDIRPYTPGVVRAPTRPCFLSGAAIPATPDPEQSTIDARRQARNRGIANLQNGNYDGAITNLSDAIRLDPNHFDDFNSRGVAYYGNSDYDHAIADFNEATRLNTNYAVAYLNRGNAYYSKFEYDRAIGEYTEAIRLDPNYATAYLNRGNAYYSKFEYDRAIVDYIEAIRLDPTIQINAKLALAYENRDRVHRPAPDQKGERPGRQNQKKN